MIGRCRCQLAAGGAGGGRRGLHEQGALQRVQRFAAARRTTRRPLRGGGIGPGERALREEPGRSGRGPWLARRWRAEARRRPRRDGQPGEHRGRPRRAALRPAAATARQDADARAVRAGREIRPSAGEPRAAAFPPPPTPRRVPPTPAAPSAPDPASNAGPGARSSPSGVGEEGSPSPGPARGPDSSPLPSDFPVACRNSIPRTSPVGRFRKLLGPQTKSGFSSRVRVGLAAIPDISGVGGGEEGTEKGLAALGSGVE